MLITGSTNEFLFLWFSEEKTHYNNSLQSIEAKRALEVNKMSDLVSQVEAIKVEVEHLAKEVEGNFYKLFCM